MVPVVTPMVTAAADTETPLTPAEQAEMRIHLLYLRTYKSVLRLQFNAAEDLLVNGQRDPTDRGQCKHLLAKVDRQAVEAALAREPVKSNPAERARLLAGAVRLTGDVGVLLLYLENLVEQSSRAQAAQAISEVVARIDFAQLSAQRLGRLLQVMVDVFGAAQRGPALLGLLARPAFCAAYDQAADKLPADVLHTMGGLRAFYRRVENAQATVDAPALAATVRDLLALERATLVALPENVRRALVECSAEHTLDNTTLEHAQDAVLPTLPPALQARLAQRVALRWLALEQDARARTALLTVKKHQPEDRLTHKWLQALDAPRMGRVALMPGNHHGRLMPGWALDSQRDVWVRKSNASSQDEAALQRQVAVPGVALVALHGGHHGEGFVALWAPGAPMVEGNLPRHADGALLMLAAVLRTLHAVALCGVRLPDALPTRFTGESSRTPSVTLVDLDGAARVAPADALNHHAALWPALKDAWVTPRVRGQLSAPQREALQDADRGGLVEKIALLETAVLRSA